LPLPDELLDEVAEWKGPDGRLAAAFFGDPPVTYPGVGPAGKRPLGPDGRDLDCRLEEGI
jgi:hypothetical protein